MRAIYDSEAGVAYVYLRDDLGDDFQLEGSLKTVQVTDSILLDYVPATDDEYDSDVLYGIELLAPKPRPRLSKALAGKGVAHLLDDIYAVLDMATGLTASGPITIRQTIAWLP